MAGGSRCTVVILTSLLLLLNVAGLSSAEGEDVRFQITDASSNDQAWYVAGDTVQFIPSFINDGESVSVENDPSCGAVLQLSDAAGQLLLDQTNLCRGQTQSIDLTVGETYSFDSISWDLTIDGQFVKPGKYTFTAYHTATQRTASTEIEVQTPVSSYSHVDLSLTASSRDGGLQQDEEIIIGVHLANLAQQKINVSSDSGCKILLEINNIHSLASPCFGSVSDIESREQISIGTFLLPDASLEVGTNVIRVSFPDQSVSEVLEFELNSSSTVDISLQKVLLPEALVEDFDKTFAAGDLFESKLMLTNSADSPQQITFSDTCKAEMWVLDENGNVVFDSRRIKTCNVIENEYTLDSNEQIEFTLPDWTFTDLTGCEVGSGTYSVVFEIPQFHLSVMDIIQYYRSSSPPCIAPLDIGITSQMTSSNDEGFNLSLDLIPNLESVEINWQGPCSVMVSILDISANQVVNSDIALCGKLDGRKLIISPSLDLPAYSLQIGYVKMVDFNNQQLNDGDYQLIVQIETDPQLKAGFTFSWPLDEQVSSVPQTSQPVIEETPRLLSGAWSGLQTDLGTCWMFESPQDGQLLLSSAKLGLWQPSHGLIGTYSVINAPPHPACEAYQAPSFQIISIESEQQVDTQQSIETDESSPEMGVFEEEVNSVAPTVLVVITSGSILSLLVTLVLGNESLRIPSTAAGLWLFGLMGRTHETSDGRYQRGRLMGYLTANPGCHFRALMAALDMSNGQITHHLRILEAEEGIWRRKDGRLVRYYPLTNALHPDLADDDLPVPPLSPDPNSLQGKILSLLDQDGPLGEFPTQAELAHRLEKSQQLVSHHLRTLQKFGLVEKRKMGLKNRYKLTREAIFLLESNTDFNRED